MPLIAVYGNLIYDKLLIIDSPLVSGGSHNCMKIIESVGGLANFCRALADTEIASKAISDIGNDKIGNIVLSHILKCTNISISRTEFNTTNATVIADISSNTRTGIVQWGACSEKTNWEPEQNADWHHFMYLDRIKIDNATLQKFKSPISADFCNINDIDKYSHLLCDIDYIIVSELDVGMIRDRHIQTRKGIIVHSPDLIYYIIDGYYDEYIITKETGLNVVGAGDYFAAYCIANVLRRVPIDLKSIHNLTLNRLRRQS